LFDAPPELQENLATLRDLTGRTHDHSAILVVLLQHLEKNYAAMASSPEQIAARADALCLQRGRRLSVEQGGAAIAGRCCGIAPDGALRLETPEGMRNLYSGVLRKER
jgi:biotin-(acetyl-CoA carboxylase) ligase